jgi:GntR family transcriptional regulator
MRANPRYRQLADELRAQIAKGRFEVGSLMPTELDICGHYEVSRHTAREALRILLEDGMIERRQGHGTRVTAAAPHRWQRSISSINDLLQYGAHTRLTIESSTTVPASPQVADLLGVAPGTKAIHLRGMRSEKQGEPGFCVSEIYRTASRDAISKRLANVRGAVYAIIDELAIGHIGRVEQRMYAEHLSDVDAKALGTAPGSACLTIVRRYFDIEDQLLMVAVNRHRAVEFTYTTELKRSS